MTNLDEDVESILNEQSAQVKAVSALIDVKPKKKGDIGSDIEVKTDLTDKQTCLHTQASVLSSILIKAGLTKLNIIADVVEVKDRNLLSLKRKSRGEIVDVARNPDTINAMDDGGGFSRRFFSSRKNNVQ